MLTMQVIFLYPSAKAVPYLNKWPHPHPDSSVSNDSSMRGGYELLLQ